MQSPLTANWSKGRNASYPYYVCRHRGCDKFGKSVARAKVEGAFEDILRKAVPGEGVMSIFTSLSASAGKTGNPSSGKCAPR
jgi:site-specific DNA recombinase